MLHWNVTRQVRRKANTSNSLEFCSIDMALKSNTDVCSPQKSKASPPWDGDWVGHQVKGDLLWFWEGLPLMGNGVNGVMLLDHAKKGCTPVFKWFFSLTGNQGEVGTEDHEEWAKFVQRQIQFDGKIEQGRKPTGWKGCLACWGWLPTSGQCLKRAGCDGLFRKLLLPAWGAWVWHISSGSNTVSQKKIMLELLLFSDSPRSSNRANGSCCRERWLVWGLHWQLNPTLRLLQETILQLAGKLVLNAASFSVPYQNHCMLHITCR